MAAKLRDPTLFREKAYIDGQWLDAESGSTFDVVDPTTNSVIGSCPEMFVGAAQLNALGSHNVHLGPQGRLTLLLRQPSEPLTRFSTLLQKREQEYCTNGSI